MTGVDMEALTAANIAALTLNDMCKAMDKGMILGPTYLLSKTGGRAVTILARSWLNEQMEGRNFTDEYKVVSENEKTEVEFF
jgi:hypothetical protein